LAIKRNDITVPKYVQKKTRSDRKWPLILRDCRQMLPHPEGFILRMFKIFSLSTIA